VKLTFKKSERITSLKEIDSLFERGHSSGVTVFPIRAVYRIESQTDDNAEPAIKVLVSVAKKRLHHAVDRNRAKRQVREAYRLQHQQLTELLQSQHKQMALALVWLADEEQATSLVFDAVAKALHAIYERQSPKATTPLASTKADNETTKK